MRSLSLRPAMVGFLAGALALSGVAYATQQLAESTREDLMTAMKDEAFSVLQYETYAAAARTRGDEHAAAVFENIAKAEKQNHFAAYAKAYGLVGTDVQNVKDAMQSESYTTAIEYPRMARRADAAGDHEIANLFRSIAKDEAGHDMAFRNVLNELEVH